MKKIGTILRFELGNYFGSKSYLISTILLALLCVGIMFAPRIKESFTSGSPSSDKETDAEDESDQENESVYAYYDASGIMDEGLLAQASGRKDRNYNHDCRRSTSCSCYRNRKIYRITQQ